MSDSAGAGGSSGRTHFQIPYAAIQSVHRHRPGQTSVGDQATVRLDPGMIAFLETPLLGTGIPIGAGYQARFHVPFGIAATAAYALIAPLQSAEVSWTGFDVELHWQAPADIKDAVLAQAEVTSVDPGLACLAISSRTTTGRSLFTGNLRLRALRGGKPVPTALLPASTRTPEGAPGLPGSTLLASVAAPRWMELGSVAPLRLQAARDAAIELRFPPGAGLSLENGFVPSSLRAGEAATWQLRADRPDEVNFQRPWRLEVIARGNGVEERHTVDIAVPDPRPRRIFYILNEDCETFDGGPLTGNYGAGSVLGNANNFMDPEDYRVQMIEKPDRMNQIAERHGARWTHFWCVPQRFAVDWAASQSATGAWPEVAAALDESVRRGSVRHEYAPHIHFDYEPDSRHPPQPRLVYDAATDGILPKDYYDPISNPRHHYHDWDGSARGISYVKALGDLTDVDSKTGSLYKCLLYLARMQANRRYPLIARTGGFDFGTAPEDQAISTAAYQANGLLANSDARFVGSPLPRGRQAYWCRPRDRMREVTGLDEATLLQLADACETDFADPGPVNQWFASAASALPEGGVHLLAAMTHAMFMQGTPDPFRSLEGGSFAGLDQHLNWVRSAHPDVEFATASEAIVEYLDYYTPELEAYVSPVLCGSDPEAGLYEYGVRLLGEGIRVDERHPARLRILAPPLFPAADVERLRLVAEGREVLAEEIGFVPSSRPGLLVTLTRRPGELRLQVFVRPAAIPELASFHTSSGPTYAEPPEAVRKPLFRLVRPRDGHSSTDVLRLLMNPVAGASEPLGRRIHPLGVSVMGAALTAVLEAAGGERHWRPAKLRLRWRKAAALEASLYTACERLSPDRFGFVMRDGAGDLIAEGHVELSPHQEPDTLPAPDYAGLLAESLNMKSAYSAP